MFLVPQGDDLRLGLADIRRVDTRPAKRRVHPLIEVGVDPHADV